MSDVRVCPVCGGACTMPADFYDPDANHGQSTAGNSRVMCRSCGGAGIIIVQDVQCLPCWPQPSRPPDDWWRNPWETTFPWQGNGDYTVEYNDWSR